MAKLVANDVRRLLLPAGRPLRSADGRAVPDLPRLRAGRARALAAGAAHPAAARSRSQRSTQPRRFARVNLRRKGIDPETRETFQPRLWLIGGRRSS